MGTRYPIFSDTSVWKNIPKKLRETIPPSPPARLARHSWKVVAARWAADPTRHGSISPVPWMGNDHWMMFKQLGGFHGHGGTPK